MLIARACVSQLQAARQPLSTPNVHQCASSSQFSARACSCYYLALCLCSSCTTYLMAIFKASRFSFNRSAPVHVRDSRGSVDTASPKPEAASMPARPRTTSFTRPMHLTRRRIIHSSLRLPELSSSDAVFPHTVPQTTPCDVQSSSSPAFAVTPLLQLSFAQCRKDIRWRKEGFEMASGHSDTVPFALHTHTLVPLDIAYSRDDIRRRDEAFEELVSFLDANSERAASFTSTSVSCPTVCSLLSTLPSSYSCSSWTSVSLRNDRDESHDSVLAVYEAYEGFSLYELGYGAASDEAVVCSSSPYTSVLKNRV